MQYKEFLVLQGRVIDVLKNYAIFLKRGAQLNYRYTKEYKDEILKDFIIRNENTMLVTALSLLNDKKSLEEVDKYIQDYKKNYQNEYNVLSKRIIASESVSSITLDENKQKELEKHYFELLEKYNPLLRMETNSEYIRSYELLQLLFQQNNYQTYFASYELFKDMFSEKDFTKVDFDKYMNYYLDLMQKIAVDIQNRKKNYPFTIESVFEDEISIAREKGEFKAKINKLIEANKAIKEDFKEAYGEIVEL